MLFDGQDVRDYYGDIFGLSTSYISYSLCDETLFQDLPVKTEVFAAKVR